MRPSVEGAVSRDGVAVSGVLKNAYFAEVDISLISPDPDQPRKSFDEDDLKELALSIDSEGQAMPALLRPDSQEDGRFIIIAGERRWRAVSQFCKKTKKLKALVCPVWGYAEAYKLSVMENVHRRDLFPIEEARAYLRLTGEMGMTRAEVSRMVGKSQVHITDYLFLLKLHPEVQKLLDPSLSERRRLGVSAAIKIAKNSPAHLHLEMAEFYMRKGATLHDLEERVAEVSGKNRPADGRKTGKNHRSLKTFMQRLKSVMRRNFPSADAVWASYFRHGHVPLEEIDDTLTLARELAREVKQFVSVLEKVRERKTLS